MYKLKNKIRVNSFKNLIQEEPIIGMSIEEKVRQMMDQNEPITDTVPMIYTSRDDGVKPEHDIRTCKWDYAIEAMGEVNNYKKTKYLQGGINENNMENNTGDNKVHNQSTDKGEQPKQPTESERINGK